MCTIKCTPKQVTYLYAKVGPMLHQQRSHIQMRFEYAAQNKCNFFSSKLNMGDNIFCCPDREVGHKTNKRSTNKIRATKRFVAVVRHGPRKQESRPKSRIAQPMGDENFRGPSTPGPRKQESRPNLSVWVTKFFRGPRTPGLRNLYRGPKLRLGDEMFRGTSPIWATECCFAAQSERMGEENFRGPKSYLGRESTFDA